ncbi:hypothetical protein SAMN06265338_1336 [Rhodoblastus acidophilus]|uniref:Uncharacterized protein n=1 Tax=Rhodoblastus acidophilus TaxID=1074 RepID=A0A212SET3_RHOAC|nr:hypothetical protein [Rhodoblastus acidophilus]PPQ34943.1 hypothetical protein CKO16_21510 [Rhodoblastus acidophilus]RAI16777.1 hypothetical protein CH337_19595 [Rhodoblastus acidophilus]SNB84127.1 hypothetical protein SAMN06265338_1336 [Rhodoblastus acidophilus]
MIEKWIKRHPQWFAELRYDIEAGHTGWDELIDAALMTVEDVKPENSFRIVQIKEKFGLLTIHTFHDEGMPDEVSDQISAIFARARQQSAHICEICSAPARVGADQGCMSVRCASCSPQGWVSS